MTPVTHDTFVIGIKNGKITFIKSYEYHKQQEEAQKDLAYVQDKDHFTGWYISHAGQWILQHKNVNDEAPLQISIPKP